MLWKVSILLLSAVVLCSAEESAVQQQCSKLLTDSSYANAIKDEFSPYLKFLEVENFDFASFWSAVLSDERIQNLQRAFDEFDGDKAELMGDIRANPIYNIVRGIIRDKIASLPEHVDIEKIDLTGIGEIGFLLENIIITGLNKIEITLIEGSGYNINNFTFKIPELVVSSDHYQLEGLQIACLIRINGAGTFRITLTDFSIFAKIDVKYRAATAKFQVIDVPLFDIALGNAQFELQDLGQNGEAVSKFINGLIGDVVTAFVKALNEELKKVWDEWKGLFMVLIENTMNKVLCPIINSANPSVCDPPATEAPARPVVA